MLTLKKNYITMQCKKESTNRMMIRTLIATLRASNPLTTYMYSGNWLLEPLDSTVLSWVAINKSYKFEYKCLIEH